MELTEKLKLLRKANNLTQLEFANSIGISRGNLANIERGKVKPTPMFINCVALTYNVDRNWLTDENNNDLSALNSSTNMASLIMERYNVLDDAYKTFVENQITELLEIQKKKEHNNK